MRKKFTLLVILITLITFSTPVLSLTCTVRFGSCATGEVCILSMNSTNNSHAARCDYFGYKLCCTDVRNASIRFNSCSTEENPILSINSTENAHVAEPTGPASYGYKVCVDWLNCTINSTDCVSPWERVASLNSTTNSHIAQYDYFGNKLCCGECDSSESFCNNCFQQNILSPGCTAWPCWSLGGDLPGANYCCGDDVYEYKTTRVCAFGICDTDVSDDACCGLPNKCVYNSICYENGWVGDIDGDGIYEECSAGIWILRAPWWRILWRDIVEIITKILGIR